MTELTPVQIEALVQSKGKEGFLYGLDPGLGKTLTTLLEFQRLRDSGRVTHMLVICPNTLKGTWKDEIIKHGFAYRTDTNLHDDLDVFIINYEAVIYSGGGLCRRFMRRRKILLVCDESSRIKNFKAAVTKTITQELYPMAAYTRCLNGTPMTESPMDLFPQLRLCGATPGVNPFAWRAKWCKMGGFKGKQIKGCKDPKGLARFCAPYMFRATKEEWARYLPEKTFSVRKVAMDGHQARIYHQMKTEFCSEYDSKEITATMAMTVHQKLSQISAGFVRTDAGEDIPLCEHNPKLDAMIDWISEFQHQRKVVIVAVNKFVVKEAVDELNRNKYHAIPLYGDSELEIDQAKDMFNQDEHWDAIVMTQATGSMGLTLLGTPTKPCSDMMFLQTSYSLLQRLQTIDRIHRIGQNWPCNYVDVVASPYDQTVVNMLTNKENLVDSVMRFLRADHDVEFMQLAS